MMLALRAVQILRPWSNIVMNVVDELLEKRRVSKSPSALLLHLHQSIIRAAGWYHVDSTILPSMDPTFLGPLWIVRKFLFPPVIHVKFLYNCCILKGALISLLLSSMDCIFRA